MRRHSIAVGLAGRQGLPGQRRGSFQADLQNLTRSMSAGLNLLQRRLSRDKFQLGGSDLVLDRTVVQAAFARHYHTDNIKVGIITLVILR